MELFLIAITIQIALLSPGPDFMVTLRQTINYGKKYAYYSSLGIGFGIFIHIGYTLLGMGLILKNFPYFLDMIRISGALYIIYLGYVNFKSNSSKIKIKLEKNNNYSLKKSFLVGFLTDLLNPKATLFFLSIFTAIVSIDTPLYIQSLYGLYCILANIFWYMFVANILSRKKNLDLFNKHQNIIEKIIGIILILLGIKLIFS
ncbi:LysE family transporter [Aliarcobacter butzleri]|uniref:LysE family translocator n=1 Tax=Aliarcobacter butzleri TaxID=28197 RepID=UPI0021B4CC52|nr:LysE family transporter [Aliarcobacter butzleri]MCT7584660.1 LysE family transporter [Aliarcobacter butzleri]